MCIKQKDTAIQCLFALFNIYDKTFGNARMFTLCKSPKTAVRVCEYLAANQLIHPVTCIVVLSCFILCLCLGCPLM